MVAQLPTHTQSQDNELLSQVQTREEEPCDRCTNENAAADVGCLESTCLGKCGVCGGRKGFLMPQFEFIY